MTEKEKSSIEELKEDYKEIQEKYGLPDFGKLNEDFQIEKASESETVFLIREIRKIISDKLFNYLRFIEGILHPVNVPMIVYTIVKTLGEEEKKKLSEIYKKLAKMEVVLFEIDVSFSEEKEADFIKRSYIIWQEVKKEILEVVEVIKANWDHKSEPNGNGYFG